ncbi:MAG: transglycosylase domain-containing protein, partial [Pseudomonadota bacterium]
MRGLFKTRWRRGLIAVFAFLTTIAALDFLFPPPLEKAKALSPLVVDRNGEWLHAFATPEGRWRFEADFEAIDPTFVARLVTIEDKRFYQHWGVDPLAILRAGASAAKSGRIVSGASTITMQTARLLEPRKRTLGAPVLIESLVLDGHQPCDKGRVNRLEIRFKAPAPFRGRKGVQPFSVAVHHQRRQRFRLFKRRRKQEIKRGNGRQKSEDSNQAPPPARFEQATQRNYSAAAMVTCPTPVRAN